MQTMETHPLSPAKVYGPYVASDPRRRIVLLHFGDGRKKTMSLARYLMECHLQRELSRHEEVDHVDNDPSNNDLSNLQVLTPSQNVRKSTTPAEWYHFTCPVCGIETQRLAAQVRHNWKLGKVGPYCSKRCAGKVHH